MSPATIESFVSTLFRRNIIQLEYDRFVPTRSGGEQDESFGPSSTPKFVFDVKMNFRANQSVVHRIELEEDSDAVRSYDLRVVQK